MMGDKHITTRYVDQLIVPGYIYFTVGPDKICCIAVIGVTLNDYMYTIHTFANCHNDTSQIVCWTNRERNIHVMKHYVKYYVNPS